MQAMPIVRLTVEQMQFSIVKALSEYAVQMDEQIQEAVKKVCTPEAIQKMLEDEAQRSLNAAIIEEMRNFYYRGDGRKYVREKVEEMLKREMPA